MMRTSNIFMFMLAVGLVAAILGCGTVVSKEPAIDANWSRFVEIASRTTADNYSEADRGKQYYMALESLGLTNCVWIHKPVLVATGDRSRVCVSPTPAVWGGANSHVLLTSGDVTGDTRREFIFAAGWWGPMAGLVAVYDTNLVKLTEMRMECIWGVELKDITGDGADEILCWEDEHHGSGQWIRSLVILKYVDAKGLVVVWRGSTYDEGPSQYLNKYDIRIEQEAGRAFRIRKKHVFEQFFEPGDADGNRRLVKQHPNAESSYSWNPATLRFEEDDTMIGEQPPAFHVAPRRK